VAIEDPAASASTVNYIANAGCVFVAGLKTKRWGEAKGFANTQLNVKVTAFFVGDASTCTCSDESAADPISASRLVNKTLCLECAVRTCKPPQGVQAVVICLLLTPIGLVCVHHLKLRVFWNNTRQP
jgi:hypothetical protein